VEIEIIFLKEFLLDAVWNLRILCKRLGHIAEALNTKIRTTKERSQNQQAQ